METGIAPNVWLDHGYQAINTALDVLKEKEAAARGKSSRAPGAGGPPMSG